MNTNFSWPKMLKVILITGLVSVPSIVLAGYAVYILRRWLAVSFDFRVPDPIYLLVLFLVMWGAMWATAGRFVSELRKAGNDSKEES